MKVCLIGDGAVGKTSLRDNYMGRGFTSNYIASMGADLSLKYAEVETEDDKKYSIKFQIWDLAGQPKFSQVRSHFYVGTTGALLVFDITRRESLVNLQYWLKELFTYTNPEKVGLVVLGNKKDLKDQTPNVIKSDEIRETLKNIEMKMTEVKESLLYLETSAKTGENVDKAFELLALQIIEKNL